MKLTVQALLILGFLTIFMSLAVSIFVEYSNIRNLETDFSRGVTVHSESLGLEFSRSHKVSQKPIETISGQYRFLNNSKIIFSVKSKSLESFRLSASALFYKGIIDISDLSAKITIKFALSIVFAYIIWWLIFLGMLVNSLKLDLIIAAPILLFGILAVIWYSIVGRSAHDRILTVLTEVKGSLTVESDLITSDNCD